MGWPTNSKICTIFYTGGFPVGGWSEVYYLTTEDYSEALDITEDLRNLRIAMMPDSFQAVYIRVSDPNIKGDAVINPAVVTGTFGGVNQQAMPASTAVLIRMYSNANQIPSFRYFHGLPECIQSAGVYTPAVCAGDGDWDQALSDCLDMIEANYLMRQKTGPGPDDFGLVGINDLLPVRITNKRIGRPFGLSRGRSPNCPTA